jgi:hypothetical protein
MLVARHLTLGHSPQALIATLADAVLREDAGFHACQMLEAGVRQFGLWGNTDAGRHILVAVVRYLAAHSPTERAALQTADIARRLMRGGDLHQEVSTKLLSRCDLRGEDLQIQPGMCRRDAAGPQGTGLPIRKRISAVAFLYGSRKCSTCALAVIFWSEQFWTDAVGG